jgi:hypothetical protein
MHGQVFPIGQVRKDHKLARFVSTDALCNAVLARDLEAKRES